MKRTGSSAALACALTSLLVAHSVSAEPLSRNTSGFAVLASEPTDRIYLSVAVPEAGAAGQSRRFVAHGSQVGKLRQLIGWVDAGAKDYDAVQYGARVRPGKRPTQMTIGEIFRWIEQTPGQPHAIGRYQFIPATLRSLVRETGLDPRTRFSPDVQDLLADILLEDAGLPAFLEGRISRHRFMENLARIWAAFPTASGRSHYHGIAGNRAVISWAEFDTHMKAIFVERQS